MCSGSIRLRYYHYSPGLNDSGIASNFWNSYLPSERLNHWSNFSSTKLLSHHMEISLLSPNLCCWVSMRCLLSLGEATEWGTPGSLFWAVLAVWLKVSITEHNSGEWTSPRKDAFARQGRPSWKQWLIRVERTLHTFHVLNMTHVGQALLSCQHLSAQRAY